MRSNRVIPATCLLIFLGSSTTLGETTTIALTGQQAPGTAAGVTFTAFDRALISNTPVNAAGQIVFYATIAGPGVTPTNNGGIWVGGTSPMTLAVREGNASAGTISGLTYGVLDVMPSINANGQIVFQSSVVNSSGITQGDGSWMGSPGALQLAIVGGQTAPGTSGAQFNVIADPLINDTNQFSVYARLVGSGVSATNDSGIWTGTPGNLSLHLREGSAAPGAGGALFGSSITGFNFNNSGHISLVADVTGSGVTTSNNAGLWSGPVGSVQLVAREGSAAGGIAGATYAVGWNSQTLNNANQVLFSGYVAGTGITAGVNDHAMWIRSPSATPVLAARAGQQSPGLAIGVQYKFFEGLQLNDAGTMLFGAQLQGAGVTTVNNNGLWAGSAGNFRLIARKGDQAPGTGAGVVYNSYGGDLHKGGQIEYLANLTGAGVTTANDTAIWLADQTGESVLIVREGNSLEVSPGVLKTVSKISFMSGREKLYGRVSYYAEFTDGAKGYFQYLPELHWRASGAGADSFVNQNKWTLSLDPQLVHNTFIDPQSDIIVTGPTSDGLVKSLTIGGGLGQAELVGQTATLGVLETLTVTQNGKLTQVRSLIVDSAVASNFASAPDGLLAKSLLISETGVVSATSVAVGNANTGIIIISSGGVLTNTGVSYIGQNSGSTGTSTVAGVGSKWTNSSNLYVGHGANAQGTLSIQSGGEVTSDFGVVASQAGSVGQVNISGSGSKWTNSGFLEIGSSGSGTLNISSGSVVSSVGGYLAYNSGSQGSVTVTDSGSQWMNSSNLYLSGDTTQTGGTATLTIQNSGLVSVAALTRTGTSGTVTVNGGTLSTGSLDRTLGTFNHFDGTVKINGGSYTQTLGPLIVAANAVGKNPLLNLSGNGTTTGVEALVIGRTGNTQNGSLRIEAGRDLNITGNNTVTTTLDGSEIRRGNSYLGLNAGSTGSATVTGAGSTWSNTERLHVGYGGTGTLSVEDGAAVTSKYGFVSFNSGSSGTATITGTGSKWTAAWYLFVGYNGSGTLNTTAGGEVVTPEMYLGIFAGQSGTANVSGANSVWNISSAMYVGGNSLASGGTGSLAITNSGQVNVTGLTKLWNAATLTIDGGTLNTTNFDRTVGTVNHYDGTLKVNGGVYTQTPGALIVAANAVSKNPLLNLSGNGTTSGLEALVIGKTGNTQNGSLLIEAGRVVNVTGLGEIPFEVTNLRLGTTHLGYNSGSTGTATVTGVGSQLINSDRIYVGGRGAGSLTIQNGGLVTNTAAFVGESSGSSGTTTVTGVGSKWTSSQEFYLGYQSSSSGQLTIQNGGEVVTGGSYLSVNAGSSGSATVSGLGSKWTHNQFNVIVGYHGTGSLIVEDGAQVTNAVGHIGFNTGSNGNATVTGSGSQWLNSTSLNIGGNAAAAGGTGLLTINNGGLVSVVGTTKLWNAGTLTIEGGTLSTGSLDRSLGTFNFHDGTVKINGGTYTQAPGALIVSGNTPTANPSFQMSGGATDPANSVQAVVVGSLANQKGELLISGGSKLNITGTGSLGLLGSVNVDRGRGYIGLNSGSSGTVSVTGVGSEWTNQGTLEIGVQGSGTLNVNTGGKVASQQYTILGSNAGSTGTAHIAGTNSVFNSTDTLVVGQNGTGNLNVTAGAKLSNAQGRLALNPGSQGTGNITGAGSEWNNSAQLGIGVSGAAMLSIQDGAKVNNTDGFIALSSSSSATVNVSGVNSQWNNSGFLSVGSSGTATLNITDSGQVNVIGVTTLYAGDTLSMNGGMLQTGSLEAASSTSKIQLTGNANTINLTGGVSTFLGTVEGTGGFIKAGPGTLSLTGPNTYAGGTTINAGTVSVGPGGSVGSGPVTNNATFDVARAGLITSTISGTGSTTVTASGATLTANHIRQSGLTIGAGNSVTVAANGTNSGTSVVTNLNINATGKLDLNDNDLVVDNGNLTTLTAKLATGLDINGSYGNGPGITSSAFASNPNFNTVLGIAANVELGYTSFSGQTVDTNDILIKYTYYGDADLSGSVDTSTDFDLYITGLTSGGSLGGWLYGDFDYNGTVDSSTDFDLYITGLTSQGAPLLTAGGGGSITAVPEPSTWVMGSLGMLGLAAWRQRSIRKRQLLI